MVGSEYSTEDCKPSKINIRAIIRNTEILKFVPDYLKTKKMCKHTVKKFPFLKRYDLDRYKTQQICDTAFSENGGKLEPVLDCSKDQQLCDKSVDNYPLALKFVPDCYITQNLCDKSVNIYDPIICSCLL